MLNVAGVMLAAAFATMTALHVLQPELSPTEEPISFYIHGAHGWVLTVSLASFGASAVALSAYFVGTTINSIVSWFTGFGAGMLIDAAVRSDPWFPWESAASLSGMVHAAAAIMAPPLLLVPMTRYHRMLKSRAQRIISAVLIMAYFGALLASSVSMVVGFARDIAPPLIGAAERGLAMAAVLWMTLLLRTARASLAPQPVCANRNAH
ncbi:MAG: DUF998 domain-containing protein [Opitutus sp.]